MLQVKTAPAKRVATSRTAGVAGGHDLKVGKEDKASRKIPLSVIMRAMRERKGKTLDEMAEITGLAKSTLWEMENDYQIDPRLSTLKRVCWAYGFAISRIDNHDVTA